MNYVTPANITFVLGLLGVLFTVYNRIRDPQETSKIKEATMNLRISDISSRVDKMISNDLPHIDAKIETMRLDIQNVGKDLVRLETTINERIPKLIK